MHRRYRADIEVVHAASHGFVFYVFQQQFHWHICENCHAFIAIGEEVGRELRGYAAADMDYQSFGVSPNRRLWRRPPKLSVEDLGG